MFPIIVRPVQAESFLVVEQEMQNAFTMAELPGK